MIDLSALEVFDRPVAGSRAPTGEPLHVPLNQIDQDPNQPRKEFSDDAMREMTASVSAKGVKSPVSVRSHPDQPGRFILNFGARRLRASIAAGRETIPAFIDEAHDDYDQVIENEQRENLTPMERALFIKRKLADGETAGKIAKKLGKPNNMVTEHMALIDMPACIEEVYTSGKSQSPKTVYDLRKLYDKHPEKVEAWCVEAEEITRRRVAELTELLNGRKQMPPKLGSTATEDVGAGASNFRHDENSDPEAANDGDDIGGEDGQVEGPKAAGPELLSDLEHGKQKKEVATTDPSRIKKPVLLVEFDSRAATVMLHRRPTTPGLIHIKYEDGGDEIEVDASRCKISCLVDSLA